MKVDNFSKVSEFRDHEDIIYEIDTRKIYGNKIWVFFGGLWFFLVILVSWNDQSFIDFWQNEYLQVIQLSAIYFLIAIYIYSKTFIITKQEIIICNIIKDKMLMVRSLNVDNLKSINVKAFIKIGQNRHHGEIEFIGHGLLSRSLIIPIYDFNPENIYNQFVKDVSGVDKFSLLNTLDKTYYPIRNGIILGRESKIPCFEDDLEISRKHAQLVWDLGKLNLIDLGSKKTTQLNGLAISPRVKTPLSKGDKIKIGRHQFQIYSYDIRQFVSVEFNRLLPLYFLRIFIKQGLLVLLFTIFFFPLYILGKLYLQKTGSKNCTLENASSCLTSGVTSFQRGEWKQTIETLRPLCETKENFSEKEGERSLNSFIGQSCHLVALAHKFRGELASEKKYLDLACYYKISYSCSRLAIITGNSRQMANSVEDTLDVCHDQQQAQSCKELVNISNILKSPEDSLLYFYMALKLGYHAWYWLAVDPELDFLREQSRYQTTYKKLVRHWETMEKEYEYINDSVYEEILKAKYLSQYHPSRIAKTCTQGFKPCAEKFLKDFNGYIDRANAFNTLSSYFYAHPVVQLLENEKNEKHENIAQVQTYASKIESALFMIEVNLTLNDSMVKKKTFRVHNLIGNIFYFSKSKNDAKEYLENTIDGVKESLKKHQGQKATIIAWKKRLTHLEEKYDVLYATPITKGEKKLKMALAGIKNKTIEWFDQENTKGYY